MKKSPKQLPARRDDWGTQSKPFASSASRAPFICILSIALHDKSAELRGKVLIQGRQYGGEWVQQIERGIADSLPQFRNEVKRQANVILRELL